MVDRLGANGSQSIALAKGYDLCLKVAGATAANSMLGQPARERASIDDFILRKMAPGIYFLLEAAANAAPDRDRDLQRAITEVRTIGNMALAARELGIQSNRVFDVASAFEAANSNISRSSGEAHREEGDANLFRQTGAPGASSAFRPAAFDLLTKVGPKANEIAQEGGKLFDSLNGEKDSLNRKLDGLNAQKAGLQDDMNKSRQNPNANNGGGSGDGSGGGGSGGGGNGGGGNGGGGNGNGPTQPNGGEPVQLSKFQAPSPGESTPIAVGAGTFDPRGFTERQPINPREFKIPNLDLGKAPPTRTQPFSFAGNTKQGKKGNDQRPQGNTGNAIGEKGGGPPENGGAGGPPGGPVAKGPDGGGAGLGAVPNASGGEDNGAGNSGNSNFVRLTDYGGPNGEGGAGAGPAGDNTEGSSSKTTVAQNGAVTGLQAQVKEVKSVARVRGLGLMANVGNMLEFCSDTKGVSVGLCDAATGRNKGGRAFRAPASSDASRESVGELVAAKLSGPKGSARGFGTVAQ